MSTVFVVLPAYNEEVGLPPLLDRLEAVMRREALAFEVIVVDDGSADATVEVVKPFASRFPLTLHRHAQNSGLGPTLRDGLLGALRRGRDRDVAVVMDADNTHPPELIPAMLARLEECDVVIASRFRSGSRVVGVPWTRRLYSRVAGFLFQLCFPIGGVRDYTCGYRAYRLEVVRRAVDRYGAKFVDQSGFQCMVDTLLKLRALGLRFGEVPFELRYDAKAGGSKMNVVPTILATLLLVLRRRFF
ncbi:MAG: glycosyltransferase [Candidatus Eremiobacterota bacterium]